MLVFTEAQIKAFEDTGLDCYINELMPQIREHSPMLCMRFSDKELHNLLLQCIHRAESYGFTHRGPTQFFIEMILVFGSGFYNDPQYPWAAKILVNIDEIEQMERSETLYARAMKYMDTVGEPDNYHIYKSLKNLARRYPANMPLHPIRLEESMLLHLADIYPTKAAETSKNALRRLINDGISKGEDIYGFQAVRSLALTVILMFIFGHDFDNDPFYPWIKQILSQTKKGSPDAVVEKLEKSAMDWIEAVARNNGADDK